MLAHFFKMIKAVFFDFDGVLTKDELEVTTTARYVAKKLGSELEEICQIYKNSADVWKVYTAEITEEQSWRAFYNKLKSVGKILMDYDDFRAIRKEAFASTLLDRTMIDLVKKIKSNGYLVGLITNNCIERIQVISEKYGFNDIFDVIVVSEEVKAIKNQTIPFYLALKKAKVKGEESIFIDNDPAYLPVASDAGFITIHFDHDKRDYNQLYKSLSKAGVKI